MRIAPSTITRGVTYLYRWWIQAELKIVPEAYIRREGEATLVCPRWILIGSPTPVSVVEARRISDDMARSCFGICPGLPPELAGIDLASQSIRGSIREIERVAEILTRHQALLRELGEENPERDEWWRTREAGEFKVWKSPRAHRLLLYSSTQAVHGFRVTRGEGEEYFVYRSRSCKEEGRITGSGAYKLSDHALSSGRKVSNLDLIYAEGKVLLLRLLPTGAGFKVFPRRVPGFEASLG